MLRRVLFFLATVLLPICLQAQTVPDSDSVPSPLKVSLKPTSQMREVPLADTNSTASVPQLSLELRNVSAKCIVAASLRVVDKDSDGKIVGTGGQMFFRHRGTEFNCLDPGQTFTRSLGISVDSSGHPETPEVTVDFVIFGDGSTWGPGNNLEHKGYLLGKFDAFKQAQKQTANPDRSLPNAACAKLETAKP